MPDARRTTPPPVENALAEDLVEGSAFDVAGDEVSPAVVDAAVEDGDEVGVDEAARRPALALEALDVELVLGELDPQDLDRDDLPVGLAHRPEDHAHGAFAEAFFQEIAAEAVALVRSGPSRHERHLLQDVSQWFLGSEPSSPATASLRFSAGEA